MLGWDLQTKLHCQHSICPRLWISCESVAVLCKLILQHVDVKVYLQGNQIVAAYFVPKLASEAISEHILSFKKFPGEPRWCTLTYIQSDIKCLCKKPPPHSLTNLQAYCLLSNSKVRVLCGLDAHWFDSNVLYRIMHTYHDCTRSCLSFCNLGSFSSSSMS